MAVVNVALNSNFVPFSNCCLGNDGNWCTSADGAASFRENPFTQRWPEKLCFCIWLFRIFASFFENCFTQRWPAKWSRTDCLLIKLSRIYRLRFRNGPQRHTFGEKIKQLQGRLFFTCFGIRSGLFLECRKIAVITFLMSSDMIQCTRSQVAAKIMMKSAIVADKMYRTYIKSNIL